MSVKLVITADLHGIYSVWQKICSLLNPDDMLILAGDTFGTRYPHYDDPDYRPADIRAELNDIPHSIVYGNCDIPAFSPELAYTQTLVWKNKKIFIHHGDAPLPMPQGIDMVITGHTHEPSIRFSEGLWHVNPGSPTRPRTDTPTYAIMTRDSVQILTLSGTVLVIADFASRIVQQKPKPHHAAADCG